MKKILNVILVLLFISCKKEDKSPGNLYVNNQFIATVIHGSDTTKINAYGWNADISGCSAYGPAASALGINNNNIKNEQVYFSIDSLNYCVNNTGTYTNIGCTYEPNTIDLTGHRYENTGVYDRGSVTITKWDGKYAEGYFNSVCKNPFNLSDSVFVKGTFKGFLPL